MNDLLNEENRRLVHPHARRHRPGLAADRGARRAARARRGEVPALVSDARSTLADLGKLARKLDERSAALDRMARTWMKVGVAARFFRRRDLAALQRARRAASARHASARPRSQPTSARTRRASFSARSAESRGRANPDSGTEPASDEALRPRSRGPRAGRRLRRVQPYPACGSGRRPVRLRPGAAASEAQGLRQSLLIYDVSAPAWLDSPSIYYRLAYQDAARPQAYADSRWVMSSRELFAVRLRGRLPRRARASSTRPTARAPITLCASSWTSSPRCSTRLEKSRAVVRLARLGPPESRSRRPARHQRGAPGEHPRRGRRACGRSSGRATTPLGSARRLDGREPEGRDKIATVTARRNSFQR